MSQTNAFKQANNPDRVYYDILQTNIGRNTEVPARFIETTDTPIINNTGDYKMSVVRFQIDTPNMPVLIIQPNTDNTVDPATHFGSNSGYIATDYFLTFNYYGADGQKGDAPVVIQFFIDWKPENPNVYKPSFDEYKDGKHINFEYFYCYSYSYFFDFIVNQSIQINYGGFADSIDTYLPAGSEKDLFINQFSHFAYPPTFEWDEASQKINVIVPPFYLTTNYYDAVAPTPSESFPILIGKTTSVPPGTGVLFCSLVVAPNFYTLISTFPARIINPQLAGVYPEAYELLFRTNFITNWIKNPAGFTSWAYTDTGGFSPDLTEATYVYPEYLVKAEQEWSSIDLMTPINSIVFTSNTLPLVLNQQSSSQSKSNKDVYTPTTQGSLTQHILTITDLMSNQQGYRPNILYVPSGQYRYITLQGNQPLNQIDINIFYQLKTGELIPFMLTNGGTASIKILFEKVVLGEAEKLQFANMSLRDLGL